MTGASNIPVYNALARIYDFFVAPATQGFRPGAVEALDLTPASRLLIVGIGTGLDLPYLPPETKGVGIDLSPGMLGVARKRLEKLPLPGFSLKLMDAEALDLPDGSFSHIYLPLIVAIVPDGAAALGEAARVAAPGARIVIVDKFWPERTGRPWPLRLFSNALGRAVTHIDRRFSEIHAGAPELRVISDRPVMMGGYLRQIVLEKPQA